VITRQKRRKESLGLVLMRLRPSLSSPARCESVAASPDGTRELRAGGVAGGSVGRWVHTPRESLARGPGT
jgi:hypothetical protein